MNDTIRGQRHYLDAHSESSGVVQVPLASARVWWWLLTDKITSGGKTWNNRGHVAALYQDELYEVRTGNAGRAALKDFGVYAGHHRIVIYVEPSNVLKANTPRTSLILAGNLPVDYAEVGAAFADAMPDELAAFMAGQVTSDRGDHKKAIRKSLQDVEQELKQVRYRRTATGQVREVEPEEGIERGGPPHPEGGGYRRSGSGDASGRLGSEYLRKAREEQGRRETASPTNRDQMPTVYWSDDATTVPAGRAASYTAGVHVVTASTTFRFYKDILAWAEEEARSRGAADMDGAAIHAICEDEVKRWFEQALVEAVVNLRPMAHNKHWGPKVYETGLSDEGLTAAVMSHRWHMMSAIKRGLAGRLGKTKPA